jgi:hypothetical protein
MMTSQETTTRDRKRSFPFVRIYTSINDILPKINLLIFSLLINHSWLKKIDGATANQQGFQNVGSKLTLKPSVK